MQEPLDLLNFMNGTGTQMPDVGFSDPLIAKRAPNNIPIPSGITSLTFNKENNYGGGVEGIIPPNSFRPMPLPDLSFPTTPGIGEGLLPGPNLVAENFNLADQPLPDISLSYEQAIARQAQRDVKSP